MIYCATCTHRRQSGLNCPTCDSPLVFPSPVEIVESIMSVDRNVVGMLKEWLAPGTISILVKREANFVVLQKGLERLTVWQPVTLKTKLD